MQIKNTEIPFLKHKIDITLLTGINSKDFGEAMGKQAFFLYFWQK